MDKREKNGDAEDEEKGSSSSVDQPEGEVVTPEPGKVYVAAPVGDSSGAHQTVGLVEVESQEIFLGPLPHPEILRQYGQILPDAPERILAVFEKQVYHRIGLEKQQADAEVVVTKRGQLFAFVLSMTVVSIGGFLIWEGLDVQGFALVITALVGLAALMWAANRRPASTQNDEAGELAVREDD